MHARASHRQPLQIDTLGPLGRGRLELTCCPGKWRPHAPTAAWGRVLDTDLSAVFGWGARSVVTLMEMHELELLGVPEPALMAPDDRGCWDPRCALRAPPETGPGTTCAVG